MEEVGEATADVSNKVQGMELEEEEEEEKSQGGKSSRAPLTDEDGFTVVVSNRKKKKWREQYFLLNPLPKNLFLFVLAEGLFSRHTCRVGH